MPIMPQSSKCTNNIAKLLEILQKCYLYILKLQNRIKVYAVFPHRQGQNKIDHYLFPQGALDYRLIRAFH